MMLIPFDVLFLLLSALCTLSYPLYDSEQVPLIREPNIRPLVIWHGMGDSYSSAGMLKFSSWIEEMHPGIFIHSIYIDENLEADQKAGFFGNVNGQIEGVATQLADIEELGGGFDAIGFSQGGQFLRAYVERYNSPPINNLITFGAQHMGVSDLPLCRPGDIFCQMSRNAARAGVYTTWAQKNLVQAQYFRDADQLPRYLSSNKFLTSINNEIVDSVNASYAYNFASLTNLVLVLFADDRTVVPKESAWFGSYAPPNETDGVVPELHAPVKTIIPMRLQPLYVNDLIGLRTLDESGGLILESCEGEHMEIRDECWKPLVKRFVGGDL